MNTRDHIALIDNDFLEHIVEIRCPAEPKLDIIARAFHGLDITAAMHPLIYQYELLKTEERLIFFERGVIQHIQFEDLWEENSIEESYYCWLIPELYKKITGDPYPTSEKGVLNHWTRRASLGEIHSMGACLVCGFGLFLSDDADSKQIRTLIQREYAREIPVYNRNDIVNRLPVGTLKKSERRMLKHH